MRRLLSRSRTLSAVILDHHAVGMVPVNLLKLRLSVTSADKLPMVVGKVDARLLLLRIIEVRPVKLPILVLSDHDRLLDGSDNTVTRPPATVTPNHELTSVAVSQLVLVVQDTHHAEV